MTRNELARTGVAAALRTRRKARLPIDGPIRVYDVAEEMGFDVRFVDVPTLEGMYVGPKHPTILISAHRPRGRQAFNCAHEIGHHVLGHGVTIDELEEGGPNGFDPREFSADCFAGAFLMPRAAVRAAFLDLELRTQECEPNDIYTVSCLFGVGYTTLVHHLWRSLRVICDDKAQLLLKARVRDTKNLIMGHNVNADVVPVNRLWNRHSVDIEVGDYIVCEEPTLNEGDLLVSERRGRGGAYKATRPGKGELVGTGWRAAVRVSRSRYVGMYRYRFLGEIDG